MNEAVAVLRRKDIRGFERLLAAEPGLAKKPQIVVEAARVALLPALRALDARGADFNAVSRGYRALHSLIQEEPHHETAASKERLACIEWLLGHGADPELPGAWPPARALIVAAFMGSEPFVEPLRRGGARVDVFASCALGDAAAVGGALKKDADLVKNRDIGGLTALQCCAGSRMGRAPAAATGPRAARADAATGARLLKIAALLLDAGADPRTTTPSWGHEIDAAYLAVSARNLPMLELLLDRGADATDALPSTVWSDSIELAEAALARGARVNAARSEGRPLLNEMVRWGRLKQTLWLLERGADPNLADEKGWTALHQAASRGNERMVTALLGAGGDPGRKDKTGWIPRDVAADRGHHKIVNALGGRAPRRAPKER